MFDINNAPVSAFELEAFATAVAAEIDIEELDPHEAPLILAVDGGERIEMVSSGEPGHSSTISQIDQLLAKRRRVVAMVAAAGWSPAEDVPVAVAWVLIAVGRGGAPAFVIVRRAIEDESWTRIATEHLPWFALSTAGALRAAVEHGTPLRLKEAGATELYRRPDECPSPPLDERGEL
jgi:hypothetical protein